MARSASRRVGVWLDYREAIVFSFEVDPLSGTIPDGQGSGNDWSQVLVDARRHAPRQQFYDDLLSHLGPEDEVYLLGPGPAKYELRRQIERQGGLRGTVVGLHDASRFAEVELVFPVSRTWHAEAGSPTRAGASAR